jgi:hypothetical protein
MEDDMKTVNWKFAGMRKEQSFVVYPFKLGDKTIVVQSERAIGEFDRVTGKGVLNWRGSNGKYFVHLNAMLGAEPFEFPAEFMQACFEAQPGSGDLIGTSVITGPVYVA